MCSNRSIGCAQAACKPSVVLRHIPCSDASDPVLYVRPAVPYPTGVDATRVIRSEPATPRTGPKRGPKRGAKRRRKGRAPCVPAAPQPAEAAPTDAAAVEAAAPAAAAVDGRSTAWIKCQCCGCARGAVRCVQSMCTKCCKQAPASLPCPLHCPGAADQQQAGKRGRAGNASSCVSPPTKR